MTRGTRLELRPQALAANVRRARQWAGDAKLLAMVKADAYGHGLTATAAALAADVDGFGVAVTAEAIALREAGVQRPIWVMEGFFDAEELAAGAALDLHWVVHAPWQIALLAAWHGAPVTVWLKLDTGMHRLGVTVEEAPATIEQLQALSQVTLAGLVSHFACADRAQDDMSAAQLSAIKELARVYRLPFSAANSAGLSRYPQARGAWVRPGICLYGATPREDHSAAELGLAVTQRLSARLIAIRDIDAGESVGYGAHWVAKVPSRIGVVAIGYGDGYPRHAPATTPVAVGGVRTHLAGRVSMDMLTINLTGLPQAAVGDEVELWGDTVSVDEVAQACGTISYALFCQITARVPRVVAGDA